MRLRLGAVAFVANSTTGPAPSSTACNVTPLRAMWLCFTSCVVVVTALHYPARTGIERGGLLVFATRRGIQQCADGAKVRSRASMTACAIAYQDGLLCVTDAFCIIA
jgi:hypothetical protein